MFTWFECVLYSNKYNIPIYIPVYTYILIFKYKGSIYYCM